MRVALVTGGNRGLGLETSRQLAQKGVRVVLTSRDEAKGQAAAATLKKDGLDVVFHALDVTDAKSVERLRAFIEKEFGRLDILVNNAGVMGESGGGDEANVSFFKTPVETIARTLETNTYGAIRVSQALVPLMRKGGYGRVVNVSSGMGQLTEMNGHWPGYRLSKTALNAVTRILADETEGEGILVNSVCPGWVKTDMGGPGAELTVAEGADTIVWAATLPDGGPTGGFFRERKPIAW